MFDRDPLLRAAGEKIPYTPEMIEEYIRCKEDIIYFAENYFYIQSQKAGKIKIPLYDFQKKMLKAFVDPSPYSHAITLSARQSGKCQNFTITLFVKQKLENSSKNAFFYELTIGDLSNLSAIFNKNLPFWKMISIFIVMGLKDRLTNIKNTIKGKENGKTSTEINNKNLRSLWKDCSHSSLWSGIKILFRRMQEGRRCY